MPKYKAVSTVFGLKTGDTFESDDPYYATLAKAGWLEVQDGGTGSVSGEPEGGADLSVDEGTDVEGGAGAEQSEAPVQSRHRNAPKVD